MAKQRRKDARFEGAKIVFRNFSGNKDIYNERGDRTFSLVLSEEDAQALINEGYNVKYPKPREDGEQLNPTLKVKVKFGDYPPNIVMITSSGKTKLDVDSVNVLDFAEINNIDLIITPYEWATPTGSGVTAYLKSMFITIREDEFELKYKDIPYHTDIRE